MKDLKTENILKVVYNNPTTKEEKELALKEYVDLIRKINDLTKEVKELSMPLVSKRSICGCREPKVEHSCQNCKGEIKHS